MYTRNTGISGRSACQSAPCGTLSSSTMIVRRIAITPSLNASGRVRVMTTLPPGVIYDAARGRVNSRAAGSGFIHAQETGTLVIGVRVLPLRLVGVGPVGLRSVGLRLLAFGRGVLGTLPARLRGLPLGGRRPAGRRRRAVLVARRRVSRPGAGGRGDRARRGRGRVRGLGRRARG